MTEVVVSPVDYSSAVAEEAAVRVSCGCAQVRVVLRADTLTEGLVKSCAMVRLLLTAVQPLLPVAVTE